MMYVVMVIKELDDPVVELAGIFDTQEKANEACETVEEWLKDDGFDNYDVFILGAVKNFLDWCDIGKYFE